MKSSVKQESIPVGCVPAARRLYAGACFRGGLPGLGGGCVCLVWWGGVSAWSGGVSAWSGGVCLVPGGLPGPGGSAWSGGWYPSMH